MKPRSRWRRRRYDAGHDDLAAAPARVDPPAMARRLILRCLPPGHRDAVIGDLDEEYRRHVARERNRWSARWWYWRQALTSLPLFTRQRPASERPSAGRGLRNRLERLAADLRFGVRTLRRRGGFVSAAVVLLGVGIGTTTAMFSVVNVVLIRPLPYPQADELVSLRPVRPGAEQHRYTFSEGEFITYEARNETLQALAAFQADSRVVRSSTEDPLQVTGARVTASFFEVLGVQPLLGRPFDADEDRPGAAAVAVLSYPLWQQLVGADPEIVGRTLDLGARSTTIVGVMPAGFRFPDEETLYWSPLALDRVDVGYQSGQILEVIGRRKDGVGRARLQEDLDRVSAQITDESLTRYPGMSAHVAGLDDDLAAPARSPLLLSLGVVSLVLLLVCCNVAGFLLAQGMGRRRELAVRRALGASTGRLVAQLVSESAVLALCGGAFGIFVAVICLRLLNVARPPFAAHVGEVEVEPTMLGFALLATTASVLLFGLAPALTLARQQAGPGRGRHGIGRGARRFLSLLVTTQIAAGVVLLVGAALMLQTLVRERTVDPGFVTERVVTFRVSLPETRYADPFDVNRFYTDALEELRGVPFVEAASAITRIPLGGTRSIGYAWQEGRSADTAEFPQELNMRWTTPGYFDVLSIARRAGRDFDGSERPGGPLVAIVSENLAEALWPGEPVVGKRFKLGRLVDENTPWRTVIGVVAEVNQEGLRDGSAPTAYFAATQRAPTAMSFVVRIAEHAANTAPQERVIDDLRSAIAAVDPAQPIYDLRHMRELVARAGATTRAGSALLVAFALLSVILAAVGLHALIEYSVRQRAHEFGVRRALGATRTGILALVLGRAGRLTATGIALGTVTAGIVTRFLESLVFGVSPTDVPTFAVAGVAIGMVALLVSLIPAHRATRIRPDESLRS